MDRRSFLLGTSSLFVTGELLAAEPNTVLIGDSHAYVMAPWFRKVAKEYDVPVAVHARGGTSTRQWIERGWAAQVVRRYPNADCFLISLGTNCKRVERPRLPWDIDRLMGIINEDRAVWLLPPVNMKLDTEFLRDAVHANGVYSVSAGVLDLFDGIHTSWSGSENWARKIAASVW